MKRRFKLLFIKSFAISVRLFLKSFAISAGLTAGFLSVSLLAIAVNNVTVKTDWTSGSSLTATEMNNIGNGINTIKTLLESIPNWTKGTTTTDAVFNGGNVGIGTSSPAQKLDVNGNISWNVPWTDVTTFGTGYSNFSTIDSGWQRCQYRKIGDIVYLRGLATKSTALANNEMIINLPSEYLPPKAISFSVPAHGTTDGFSHKLNVYSNGVYLDLKANTTATHINLDGISFSVTP